VTKIVIFLGPTLPLEEARAVLDATYLPPVAQADLMTATLHHEPEIIGIIDGVFDHTLSVWHKEILHALELGIAVYGASSMGAIRAAETARFGMIGVGEIYRFYASGALIDDDEVALAHGGPADGYRKLSEPMVNLRATFDVAEERGVITRSQKQCLVGIAKSMYFAERTIPAILKAASDQVPEGTLQAFRELVRESYVDLKRRDALALLHTIKDALPQRREQPGLCAKNAAFRMLHDRDRRVGDADLNVSLQAVAYQVALHHPDFDALRFDALNRSVTAHLSEIFGVEVDEEAIAVESARFRAKRDLGDDSRFAAWLTENDLRAADFRKLVTEAAACRAMHRWFLTGAGDTIRSTLDELRLRGSYPDWRNRAVMQERVLRDSERADSNEPVAALIAAHRAATGHRIDIEPAAWAIEAGFDSEAHLKDELARASAARRRKR
jgi:hypothetical protein